MQTDVVSTVLNYITTSIPTFLLIICIFLFGFFIYQVLLKF